MGVMAAKKKPGAAAGRAAGKSASRPQSVDRARGRAARGAAKAAARGNKWDKLSAMTGIPPAVLRQMNK